MRIQNLIATIYSDLTDRGRRGDFTRSVTGAASVQIASTIVSLGSSLLYARVLGPHGYGLYAFVIAWTTILAVPVGLGMPMYLVREGAGRPGVIHRMLGWADFYVIAAGGIVAGALSLIWLIPTAGETRPLFVIAALIPLGTALGQTRQALLRSLHRIAASQWPLLLGPSLMLSTMFVFWLSRGSLQPWEVMAAALSATFLIVAVGQLQIRRAIKNCPPQQPPRLSLRASVPFMLLGMLFLINSRTDIILLGGLRGPTEAGIYAVVSRGAALVTLLAAATNLTLAPRIADLHRKKDYVLLQRIVSQSTLRVVMASLPLAAILLVAAGTILKMLYGHAYSAGALALQILVIGHLSTIIANSSSDIANMTGNERLTLYSITASITSNIILNLLLISRYGLDGAALGTTISLVLFNVMQWYWVRTRTGIRPTIFSV